MENPLRGRIVGFRNKEIMQITTMKKNKMKWNIMFSEVRANGREEISSNVEMEKAQNTTQLKYIKTRLWWVFS